MTNAEIESGIKEAEGELIEQRKLIDEALLRLAPGKGFGVNKVNDNEWQIVENNETVGRVIMAVHFGNKERNVIEFSRILGQKTVPGFSVRPDEQKFEAIVDAWIDGLKKSRDEAGSLNEKTNAVGA